MKRGRKSTVVGHPHQLDIERELAAGKTSIREIAEKYRVSLAALYRHRHVNVPKAVAKAAEKRREVRELATGNVVLDEINSQMSALKEMLDAATRDMVGPDGRIDFSLRARDAECSYDLTAPDPATGKMRTKRLRATMQELIDNQRGIVSVTVRRDSTPALFAKISAVLHDYLETVAKLTGQLKTGTEITFNQQINFGATVEGKKAFASIPLEGWMLGGYGGPVSEFRKLFDQALHHVMTDAQRERFWDVVEAMGDKREPQTTREDLAALDGPFLISQEEGK